MSESTTMESPTATSASVAGYTTRGAAEYLGVSVSTLNSWRLAKIGPVYEKMGRRVVYRLEDLFSFRQARRVMPEIH